MFRFVTISGSLGLFCVGLRICYLSMKEQNKYLNYEWTKIRSKPKHLVMTGPYSYSRNPVYLSYFMLFASIYGLGFVFIRSPNFHPHLIRDFVLFYALWRSIIYIEEQKLRTVFDAEYVEYCSNVNRWFGFPQRKMFVTE